MTQRGSAEEAGKWVNVRFHSGKFSAEGNFVKCDWTTQIFEVGNFQILTMRFSENFPIQPWGYQGILRNNCAVRK